MPIATIMFGLAILALIMFVGAIIYIILVKGKPKDDDK
jgi:hypothetical protein